MTMHLTLLGDSIFDNFAYTEGRPAVIDHVRRQLPAGWSASLQAVDGSVAADVPRQVGLMPAQTTHLALSVGGNDALASLSRLSEPSGTVLESLQVLADIQVGFARSYGAALAAVLASGRPLVVCTIYDHVPGLTAPLRAALSLFNDIIVREALRHALGVVDLRQVCTEPADYANSSPIEPSSSGGDKVAAALVRAVAPVSGRLGR